MKPGKKAAPFFILLFGFCLILSGCDNDTQTPAPSAPKKTVTSASQTAEQEPRLSHDELTTLLQNKQIDTTGDFKQFLSSIVTHQALNSIRTKALTTYIKTNTITEPTAEMIPALLGVWVRLHYYSEAEALLATMVKIPSVNVPSIPSNKNPDIIAMGKLIEATAWKWGLVYRNIDNYLFEVSLPGQIDEYFGILTHSDVVPADPKKWVLDDGQQLNPFQLTHISNKLYGRGTEDDKGSIVTALYAMKAIKENGLPLHRGIRLMIETTEETSGKGIQYYKTKHVLPPYNIVLDSRYPAVIAEKGAGSITATFPLNATKAMIKPTITHFVGSMAQNQITSESTTVIKGGNAADTAKQLTAAKEKYLASRGDNLSISITPEKNQVKVVVKGISAHSSRPEEGVNPVPEMASFLASSGISFADNAYKKAINYINTLYGTDYKGNKLGVAYSDPFMGPLTISPTFLVSTDNSLKVVANVRAPRGRDVNRLKQAIETKLDQYASDSKNNMKTTVSIDNWMYRDPKGVWMQTLLSVYSQVTGHPGEPVATAGSTTAKQIPNAVNFGPSMPGERYMGHTSNEFKKVDNMKMDMQLFTEMMLRMSNLPKMQ